MKDTQPLNWRYLAQEAALILLLGYLLLLGGTFNGLVLYSLNLTTAIVVGAVGIIWLGYHVWRRQPLPRTPLAAPLLVFLAAYAVAALFSTDLGRSAGYVGLLVLYVLAYFLVADLLRAGWPAELFVKSLLVVSLIVLVFGVWELERWLADWLAIGGLAHPIPPATYRVRAFLGHPNFVAAFLNLLLPLVIARALETKARLARLLLALWAIVALVLIFFTSSRGGWIGTAALMAALILLLGVARREQALKLLRALVWPRWRLALVIVLTLSLIAAGSGLIVRQSQHPTHGDLLGSRTGIWPPAWQAFLHSPWIGTGPFTFASAYLQANSVPPAMLLAHAHNYLLNIAAETGWLGLVPLIWLAIALIVSVRRRWRESTFSEQMLLAGSTASLIGIAVHSLFDTPQTMPTIDLVIAIVIGVTLIRSSNTSPHPRRLITGPWSLITDYRSLITILFIGVMVGWAGSLWSYAPFDQGVLAANLGQWNEATPWLDLAAQRNPRLAFYQFQAGYAHGVRAGAPDPAELEAALAYYRAGVVKEPDWALNLANLAALYEQAGQRDRAIAWTRQAARLAPKEAAFPLNLGRYYEADNNAPAATEAYQRALDLRPTWSDLAFWRQSALRQKILRDWLATHPEGISPAAWDDASNRLLDGWNALAAGRSEESRSFFLRSLSANDAEVYLGLGQANLALGRLDEADVALRTALFMYPPPMVRVEALLAQGKLASLRGDARSAIARYEDALSLLRNPTIFGPGTQDTSDYGWYVYNRASIAPDLLPQLLYPTFTDRTLARMMDLAAWREQSGHRDAAIQTLQEILAADPDMKPARQRLDTLTTP